MVEIRRRIIQVLLLIMLILIYIIIFQFSAQNGEVSSGVSMSITTKIAEFINIDGNENTLHIIENIIRKLAHFSIYMLVGIIAMCLMRVTFAENENIQVISSTLIGLIYAISDEVHQAFIPGRAGMVSDVILDTAGVITGIILVLIIARTNRKAILITNIEHCSLAFREFVRAPNLCNKFVCNEFYFLLGKSG